MNYEPTKTELRDARLTAYALGELSPLEMKELEEDLAGNPDMRAELSRIREVIGVVRDELESEPAEALTAAQRNEIETAARTGLSVDDGRLVFTRRAWWAGIGTTAAAASIGVVLLLPGLLSRDEEQVGFSGQPIQDNAAEVEERTGGRSPESDQPSGGQVTSPARMQLDEAPDSRARGGGPGGDAQPRARESGSNAADDERLRTTLGASGSPQPRERRAAGGRQPAGESGGFGGGGGGFAREPSGIRQEQSDSDPSAPRTGGGAFLRAAEQPLSTFSIDVDSASYSIVRRMLNQGVLPPADVVRIEELVNYFSYDDSIAFDGEHPLGVTAEVATCPWNANHRLARVSVRASEIDFENRVGANLVFLIDVSGSMRQPNKLPLLKQSMKLLANTLTADDRVGIVAYSGDAEVRMESTWCRDKAQLIDGIDSLAAGGGTNGQAGLDLAYRMVDEHRIAGGINRVIWATDGDLNQGVTDREGLVELIEEKRRSGIELTVLGFGDRNLRDDKLEAVSNAGNGNYAVIDTIEEAHRVLIDEIGGTLFTVAGDVKLQVEFNLAAVESYRLLGYENRRLEQEDFRDDLKDAGEIGAGDAVTALYEIVPKLDMSTRGGGAAQVAAEAMFEVRIRYRRAGEQEVVEFSRSFSDSLESFESASKDYQFAAAVATFGLVLQDGEERGGATLQLAEELAVPAATNDERQALVELVRRARTLRGN